MSSAGLPCQLTTRRDLFDTAGETHQEALEEWWNQIKVLPTGPRYPMDSVCNFLGHGVNVELDNKRLGGEGRINPMVLGLDLMPNSTTPAYIEALDVPVGNDRILKTIVTSYADAMAVAGDEKGQYTVNQLLGLMAWDIACTLAIRQEPDAFEELCLGSHTIDRASKTPFSQSAMLDRVIGYVVGVSDAHLRAPCIVGLQEAMPGLLTLTSVPPPGFAIHYAATGLPRAAIMYRNCKLVRDVTADPLYNFPDVWDEYMQKRKLSPTLSSKVSKTIERLCICIFEMADGERLAFVNVHVSSFKSEVMVLGDFFGVVVESVQTTLGLPTVCVADSNIDCPWDKSVNTVDEQMQAVADAAIGRLPNALMGAMEKFEKGLRLSNQSVQLHPPLGTITTMKRRTHFQAQVGKAGLFVASQKDIVLLPPDFRVVDTCIGAKGNVATNLDLLLPSAAWPADHFAVLTVCDMGTLE